MHRSLKTGLPLAVFSLLSLNPLHAQVRALAQPGDVVQGLGNIVNIVDSATFSKNGSAVFLADVAQGSTLKKALVKRSADGNLSPLIISGETSITSDFPSFAPANAKVILGANVNGSCGYQSEPVVTRKLSDRGDLLLLANISGTGLSLPVCTNGRLTNAGNSTSLILVKADGSLKVLSRMGAAHPENQASLIQRPYLDSAYRVRDNAFIPEHSEGIVHIFGSSVNNVAVGGSYFMSAAGQLSPWLRQGMMIASLPGWMIQSGGSVSIHSSTTDDLTYPLARFSSDGNYIVTKTKLKRVDSSITADAILRMRTSDPHNPMKVLQFNDFISVSMAQMPGTYSYGQTTIERNYYYGNFGRYSVVNTGTVFIDTLRAREQNGAFVFSSYRAGCTNPDYSGVCFANSSSTSIGNNEDMLISTSLTDGLGNSFPAILKWTHDDQFQLVFNGMTDVLPSINASTYQLNRDLIMRIGAPVLIKFQANAQRNFILSLPFTQYAQAHWAVIAGQKHLIAAPGMLVPGTENEYVSDTVDLKTFSINDNNEVLLAFSTRTAAGVPIAGRLGVWSPSLGLRILYSSNDSLPTGEMTTSSITPYPYGSQTTSLGMDEACLRSQMGILGMARLVDSSANIVVQVDIPNSDPAPVCAADFNEDGSLSIQDMFDFLAAYSSRSLTADMNHNDSVTVQDLFDYLRIYQQGC